MRKLHFIYKMQSIFSSEIVNHHFKLKGIPYSRNQQKIELWSENIAPISWISEGIDSFGNKYYYGDMTEEHRDFYFTMEGCAYVPLGNRIYSSTENHSNALFPTQLTTCSTKMLEESHHFQLQHEQYKNGSLTFADFLWNMMAFVYQHMVYTPGVTDTKTSAASAYDMAAGVCQDYAHILLALCRNYHIPCYYVAGYMLGEGASHAWMCALDEKTNTWYDIDPTNYRWVNEDYIEISYGLDATDCKINKGIYQGFAFENQQISVIVEEIND